MASHNPGNLEIERLALETKVNVLQSHNQFLRLPQNQLDQRPDVAITCAVLIFAMDLLEHGLSRWMVHTLGVMHVMSSLGGIENITLHYPHLHVPLLHCSLFETMWIVTSYNPLRRTRHASRNALEVLMNSQYAKHKIFNGFPSYLTLAIWDTAACAQKILGVDRSITLPDMHIRERTLVDVTSFQPEGNTQAMREEYSRDHLSHSGRHLEHWDSVGSVWKAATAILVLRYLFFGRHELVPTSSSAPRSGDSLLSFEQEEQYFQGSDEYLAAETYTYDPISRLRYVLHRHDTMRSQR
ncbi:hypothetical protein P171DRAFT_43932 [Karstenula rhodostoma CBS 690.94]|uniref:Uncharacterized protein n=1 Tax=Karstenula rhodostoma CBS 690.94 TaxID=1392251 RepID=A0A9P4UC58_9PLEO|nr:hypothetical protein P171DRAFT_43932 [Karstenula rhodostoma CBS 690.94]